MNAIFKAGERAAPPNTSLLPQQFFWESTTLPGKIWVGVPPAVDPTGLKMILDLGTTAGGGPFLPLTGGTLTGPLIYTATGGNTSRSAQDRAADVANVLDFGADPTGVADSAPAINAAIGRAKAVRMPTGIYHVRSAINALPGCHLFGDGRGKTCLTVSDDFDPAAIGVIVMTGSEDQSPILEDFSIQCVQPSDQGTRANFKTLANGGTASLGGTGVMYPPVMFCNAPSGCRFKIKGITVYVAWDGIKATTNVAPWIEDVEMGALNCGLYIGQARDFCHVRGYHFWSFGMNASTALFTGVYQDGNTFAARFGETGGLNGGNVSDFCSFQGRLLIADPVQTWMHFANLMMDGNNATLEVSGAAWLQISNLYLTGAPSGANPSLAQLNVPGGRVYVSNLYANAFNTPVVNVAGGVLRIVGGRITQATPSASSVLASSGSVGITGCGFSQNTGAGAWTAPVISITGTAVARFQNNTFEQPSVGDVGAIVLASDNANHAVLNNAFNGWGFTPPGTLGLYQTGPEFYGKTVHAGSFSVTNAGTAFGAGSAAATATVNMTMQTTGQKTINLLANNVIHWAFGSFGGADDWLLVRFNDTGVQQPTPFSVSRSTGLVTLPNAFVGHYLVNGLAAAGTTQATALLLPAQINRVTNVPAGAGVMLPPASLGAQITIYASGANTLRVYGSGSDTIDGAAAATGVPMSVGKSATFTGFVNAWLSNQLGIASA